MNRLVACFLVLSLGCGTILNGKTTTVTPPAGGAIDGNPGTADVSQQIVHDVTYPDGHHCLLAPSVGAGYVIADIILWGLIFGVLVDAVTEDWKSLDNTCPGVVVGG